MAEHKYAGVMCGIMDQFASMMAKKGQVLRLDCRSLEFEYFPLDLKDYQILLINTNVKHSLASSEYNTRRKECAEGVSILKGIFPDINSLRDIAPEMLEQHKDKLPPLIHQRCKHVVEENDRVVKACEALDRGDLETFGALVYGSHKGLSEEYEVSCTELDFLVDQTRDKDYVLGARMMGGGFGGCTINIIKKTEVEAFLEETAPKYKEEFGKEMTPYFVSIESGSEGI